MGIDYRASHSEALSQPLLLHLLATEEKAERSLTFAPEVAATIIRRGAMIGSHIERHIRCDRTMERARHLIRQIEEQDRSFPSGFVILADEVSASKGRFTRAWHAPAGGLWMTLILTSTLLPEHRHLYPLAAGVACCELALAYGVEARIKWVNDVHVKGRKLAGILTETFFGPVSGEEFILLGIGLNVNNQVFPPELEPLAISLVNLLGQKVNLELLAARLLAKLTWNIGLLSHEEDRQLAEEWAGPHPFERPALDHALLRRWRELSDSIGRRVKFGHDIQTAAEYCAEVIGLDHRGFLRLRPEGSVEEVIENSGEILYLD